MSTAGLMISLPQMVDLAIGSPECGAVNFNLLSAALQVIIQQLNLTEHVVDFRGPEVERLQGIIATAKPGLSLKISEAVDVESIEIHDRRHSEEISTTEQRRNSKEEPNAGSLKKTEKVIVVEPTSNRRISKVPHIVVGVSQELFIQINQDVEELKSKMTEMLDIANNETILEAVRAQGQDKVTPVIDMWQALNIAKRVNAAETGMEKLAGLFENLIHEIGAAKGEDGSMNIFSEINSKIEALAQRLEEGGGGGGGGGVTGHVKEEKDGGDAEDMGDALGELENVKSRLKTLETDIGTALKGTKGKNFAELFKDVEELKNKSGGEPDGEAKVGGGQLDEATLNELQEKFNEFTTKLNNLDETLSMQINKLQEQLLNIEKELGALLESTNTKNDNLTDATSVGDLFNRIVKLQEDIDNLNKITDRINDEQEERTLMIEALTEQVELMKTTKADREDLEDALADKADNQQVNRKVSTIQFDAACEDLTRHIEDTMKKLTEQEELWQSTLDELHMTIGAKLDKQEFDPLRDFVNRKIKSLQQRLKALLAMKQEQEAAGTKSKILKNVNCISCDKDVIMYKENKFSTFPTPQSMPGTRSIKPYITYELDAVRKQQKSLPLGRNMNSLESALHDEKAKKEKMPADKALPAGHLCNRYCGGSHTMTQPQQRVAHLGHFLNQWGPQAIPLDEGQIMGKDGQMYKARDASGDAPKATEEIRRFSAQMQTDETKERVPRMSSTLEAAKRDRPSRLSKGRSSIKQVTVEGELEPVKEESIRGDDGDRKKSASRLSVKKSARKSSTTAGVSKQSVTDEGKTRRSSSKNIGSPRHSQKKSQVSLKRLSQSATKEATPPRDEEAPEEGGEEPPAPTPEVVETPAEGAEGEAPPENPEEAPAD